MQFSRNIALTLLIQLAILYPCLSAEDLSLTTVSAAHSNHGAPVTDITGFGTAVLSCSQAGILCSDHEGETLRWFKNLPFRVYAVEAIGGELSKIAIAGGKPGESGILAILNIENGEILAQRTVSKDLIYKISIDSESGTIAAACNDGKIVTVAHANLQTAPITTRHRHTAIARDVAFSPDGKWLASAGHDGVVLISEWSTNHSKENLSVRTLAGHTDQVHCLAFSDDSKIVASGSRDGKVRLHKVDGPLFRTYADLGGEPISDLLRGRSSTEFLVSSLNGTIHYTDEHDDSALQVIKLSEPIFAMTELMYISWAVATDQVVFLIPPSIPHPQADSAR